ncbi:hypothetical protein ACWCWD_30535 [Streptomyces sp. NPDC001493]
MASLELSTRFHRLMPAAERMKREIDGENGQVKEGVEHVGREA